MNENIQIVMADYMISIILGKKLIIDKLVDVLNKKNMNDTIYVGIQINNPLARANESLCMELEKNIKLGDGVEEAQCYTYAQEYDKNMYMLMQIVLCNKKYILKYPMFDLINDCDPSCIIDAWFGKHFDNKIKKGIKFVTVVGKKCNVMVMSVKLIC